jgi:type VI secretion system secreted protein Hcp
MAINMFLKIDGIDGESSDDAHEGEIDVLAWNWGLSQSGTTQLGRGGGGRGGAGKANVQDLSVVKYVDSASPKLMLACAKGTHLKDAVLTCLRAGGGERVEFLKIELEHLIVSSVATSGSGGEERLTETVTLNFAQFKVTYTPQDNDGSSLPPIGPVGWNIQTNKEV